MVPARAVPATAVTHVGDSIVAIVPSAVASSVEVTSRIDAAHRRDDACSGT